MKLSHRMLLAVILPACTALEAPPFDGLPVQEDLDVTERLGPGETRAGVITDPAALFGGVSAEGELGDVKLYNDRIQVIIQGVRESSYYERFGGGMVDADVVRPEGVPGRDVLDEFATMVGLGRLLEPETVEVVSNGSGGTPAVVRVTGTGSQMGLLAGAFENPDFVAEFDLRIVTEYTLEPDSWLVQVHTEVEWRDDPLAVQVGDLAMVGEEVTDEVLPGRGLEGGEGTGTGEWLGLIGHTNEVSLALLSNEQPYAQGVVELVLQDLGPVLVGLGPTETAEAGSTLTFDRWVGVGPDLATITGAWREARGESVSTVAGTVTAGGAPVPGARVHLLDESGGLETVAHTDADGRWSARVVADNPVAVATGRGHANHVDLPSGAGWVAPYAHEVAQQVALDSLEVGASGVPFAEGFGVSSPQAATDSTDLVLAEPGVLAVLVSDGGPAVVRVEFVDGDPVSADRARVPGRPSGEMAWGYVRDGDLQMPVEAGLYRVVVHRGVSWEPVVAEVTVAEGETVAVQAELLRAVAPAGVLALDPHSHASPSGDGDIAMAHRLLTMAANGVQVHFGTDHDHVADYRPLLAPLALESWLASVVADEVSPVLRGHFNLYPLTPDPSLPNNGAPRWWVRFVSTDALYEEALDFAGEGAVLQLNHPWGSTGMLDLAGYNREDGTVAESDRWSDRFTAMEVLNDGETDEFFRLYLDLVSRGKVVTPIGVSDAHGYRNGVGENLTWLSIGFEDPGQLTDETLTEALHARRTVVSQGPFLRAEIGGVWAPGGTYTGAQTLTVDVEAASFVRVDTLDLLQDGAVVASEPWAGEAVSFELSPEQDASYVVVAHGQEDMAPVYPRTRPWAATAAVLVDLAGDGWDAPLPPVQLGN